MTSVCGKQTLVCMKQMDVVLAFFVCPLRHRRLEYTYERWNPNEKKSQCEIRKADDTPCCQKTADHEKGGKETSKAPESDLCIHGVAQMQKSRCVNAKVKLQPLCSGRYSQSAGGRMAGMAKEGDRWQ